MSKLSLRLPKYDGAIVRLFGKIKEGLHRVDPFLGLIPTVMVAHGGTLRQVSEPTVVETPMKKHEVTSTMDSEWFRNTDAEAFIDYMCEVSDSLNSLAKKQLYEVLSKTTEATGNTVDAQGLNPWDAVLEAVKKTEIHFNEDGSHDFTFVANPKTYEKMSQNPPTQEQKQQMEELMKAKKEEFNAKKRTRRLS